MSDELSTMSEQLKVLFKTKGGHKEGMGDVTSSLALAEEFRKTGHKVAFILNANKNVISLVSQAGFEFHIAENMEGITACMENKKVDIAILNQLETPEEEALLFKKHSKMLVTIEDTGVSAKLADLRVNVLYPIDDSITDFKYIPLAPVYQEKHKIAKHIKEKTENILVTQGGSDTYGFTPKILRALYSIPNDININVVLGPNFSHDQELNEVVNKAPRKYNLIRGVKDLSDLMLEADLAISAGGNTLFELACIGIPTIVVCGEPFEVRTAERMQQAGFGINLGFGRDVDGKRITETASAILNDHSTRTAMSRRGKELVGGQGAHKIIEIVIDTDKTLQNCLS